MRFEVEDNQWQEKLKLLAKHAKGILLMPALSEGTLWEVGYLMNHPQLLKKAIFLMPPKPESLRAKLKVKPSLLEEEWALLLKAFRAEGSNFPAYNKNGMLFTLNSQGNVHQKASPNWSRPSEMGRAIIRLLD